MTIFRCIRKEHCTKRLFEIVTYLVLGHERRGGAVGDHEPGVEAAVLDEEGWQLAVRGVAQPLDPPLAALNNIQERFLSSNIQ